MLERETDTILTTVREQTLGRRSSIAMKEILAADIPYPIKMFFRTDIESSLVEELRHLRNGTRFGYDHPEVQSLQRQMNSILILHYTLSAQEFDKRLGDVVHLMANYLIRPQWTMCGVLFEKESSIATKPLLGMLKYFSAYEYLRDISTRYIRDKNITAFTKQEFSQFLWKADGAYVSRKTGDELARVLTPMYEFFDYPNKTNAKRIPAQALMKFFEDKGLSSVTARLEGEIQHAPAEYSQTELGELLEDVRRTTGAFIVDQPEPEPEAVSLPALAPPSSSEQQEIAPRSSENAEPPTPSNGEPKTPEATEQFPLAKFAESIDEGDRKRYLKKIFHQDESSFQTALQFMSGLTTWREASRFIDEIFIQNDIDPYSSDAKKFIDVIFQRFYPSR